jgi:L-threonylcarbamoyladenylate synthase
MALALIFEFGSPLVAPSANPSGRVSPTSAEHVRAGFPGGDLLVLDGGACPGGIESTVVSLMDGPVRVLRPGLIDAAMIGRVLGERVGREDPAEESAGSGSIEDGAGTPLPSPGLMKSHYAPSTPAFLFESGDWARVAGGAQQRIVVLTHSGLEAPSAVRVIRMPRDASQYASRLYAALFEADAAGAAAIWIERPPAEGPVWEAVADRLARATAR